MSKAGVGGLASAGRSEIHRKARVRDLLGSSSGLSDDPYLVKNHLGQLECSLCLTLHVSEANYLVHADGRRHQENLAKRAAKEEFLKQQQAASVQKNNQNFPPQAPQRPQASLGLPQYKLVRQRVSESGSPGILLQLHFPMISEGVQPRFRFVSAFEQRVEPVIFSDSSKRRALYQYLLVAAAPYTVSAFKIPNLPVDRSPAALLVHWDEKENLFTLQFRFKQGKEEKTENLEKRENPQQNKRKREEEEDDDDKSQQNT